MENAVKNMDASTLVGIMQDHIVLSEDCSSLSLKRRKLEAVKVLLQSSLTAISLKLSSLCTDEIMSDAALSGEALLEIDNIQLFEPRGRFKIKISTSSILLTGKQFSCLIPVKSILQVICLPSNATSKKEGEDFLAFYLRDTVKFNNKETKHLLFNLSRTFNQSVKSKYGGCKDYNEATVIMMAVQEASGLHITRPQPSLFTSIRDQKPYLQCYRGTQEGAIYLLKSGVVFIKPLLIIPADQISSLTAGRGGGSGSTRYVDLMVT